MRAGERLDCSLDSLSKGSFQKRPGRESSLPAPARAVSRPSFHPTQTSSLPMKVARPFDRPQASPSCCRRPDIREHSRRAPIPSACASPRNPHERWWGARSPKRQVHGRCDKQIPGQRVTASAVSPYARKRDRRVRIRPPPGSSPGERSDQERTLAPRAMGRAQMASCLPQIPSFACMTAAEATLT